MGKKSCIASDSSMCTPTCPTYTYTIRVIVCISYVYQVKNHCFCISHIIQKYHPLKEACQDIKPPLDPLRVEG